MDSDNKNWDLISFFNIAVYSVYSKISFSPFFKKIIVVFFAARNLTWAPCMLNLHSTLSYDQDPGLKK